MRPVLARIGRAIGYATFAGVILALGILTVVLCTAGQFEPAYLAAVAFLLCNGLALAAVAHADTPRRPR